MRKTFLALRNRNFRLFFVGQLISNTGNWLTNVALTLLVLKITGSGLGVGILASFQFGPILLLSAWAGAIADRSDKRRLLLVTQSLEMAQSVGLAVLAFQPHPPLAGLYALAAVGGILLAFDNPLRRSFVSEMVPAEDLPNAVVLYSTIVNLSRLFGPALAGLGVVTLGYGWCFVVDACSYVAVLACLLLMRPAELRRRPPGPRAPGGGPGGAALPALGAGAVDQLRHAGGCRHPLLQLQRHPAAVRHRLAARQRGNLHGPVLGVQPGRGGGHPDRRQPRHGTAAPRHPRGGRPWRDHAAARGCAGCRRRGPGGLPGRDGGHSLPDLDHRDRAGRGAAGDARPGAVAPDRGADRDRARRRAPARLAVRHPGRPGAAGRRWRGQRPGGRVRLVGQAPLSRRPGRSRRSPWGWPARHRR